MTTRFRARLLLLLPALLAQSAVAVAGEDDASPAPAPTATVTTMPLAPRPLDLTLTAYGQVSPSPAGGTSVSFAHDGMVVGLHVHPGQRVAAGTPLIDVATAPASRVAFTQAQSALKFAAEELDRTRRLFKQHLASSSQVAAAEQALANARAEVAAQAMLGTGKAVDSVKAPFDGVVSKLNVALGDRVQTNATALSLARSDSLIVPLGLEPDDSLRVEAGMKVSLESLFDSRIKVTGAVQQVQGMIDPDSRLVLAIVRVDPAQGRQLILGERVRGVISLGVKQALAVPRDTVLTDDGGSTSLFVVKDGHAHRVAVTQGEEAQGWVPVEGEVKPGDRVVTVGNYELDDNMAVKEAAR